MTLKTTPISVEDNQVSCLLNHYVFVCPTDFLVAHKIYGIPLTINCATYTYCLAYQEVIALRRISGSAKAGNLDTLMTG
jgi:hypothetical protein